MPAQVYLMYSPEVWGRSKSGSIEVGEAAAHPNPLLNREQGSVVPSLEGGG